VLGVLRMLGGSAGRILLVGCVPENVEDGMGLSDAVAAAVDPAVQAVRDLIDKELAGSAAPRGPNT
jgi:hydrogenase maturation protease